MSRNVVGTFIGALTTLALALLGDQRTSWAFTVLSLTSFGVMVYFIFKLNKED